MIATLLLALAPSLCEGPCPTSIPPAFVWDCPVEMCPHRGSVEACYSMLESAFGNVNQDYCDGKIEYLTGFLLCQQALEGFGDCLEDVPCAEEFCEDYPPSPLRAVFLTRLKRQQPFPWSRNPYNTRR